MYLILYTINALLMLVTPLLLGWYFARKRQMGWGIYLAGALTFILSQVGHIPFNSAVQPILQQQTAGWSRTAVIVTLAIFLGLSAGVFEEVARYITYRFWRKDVRSWGGAMMLGAGHGGIEAIVVGLLFAGNFYFISAYDAGYLPGLLGGLTGDALAEAQQAIQFQIETWYSLPWYATILGGVERIFAIILHLSLSLIVMQSILRNQLRWLVFAVGWHAFANAGAVTIIGLVASPVNDYAAELFLAVVAAIGLYIIYHFKEPEPVEPEPEPLPPPKPVKSLEVDVSSDNLDKSRYV